MQKIQQKVFNIIWKAQHRRVRKLYRKKFIANQPTIISCNCIAGVLYNELGLQFTSPTINLYMNCEDFIKFCENLNHYLSLEITKYKGEIKRDYPLGNLGDLTLYFVHYSNFDEAKKKWEIRKKRMNFEKIYIIATDRDGFNDDLLKRFDNLPYSNKKLFSHLPHSESKNVVYIEGYEKNEQIENLMTRIKKGHLLIDKFDWIGFLNNKI